MTRILMIGTYSSLNKGDAAMQISAMRALSKFSHDIDFILLTPFPEIDSRRYTNIKIVKTHRLRPLKFLPLLFKCVLWATLYKYFNFNIKKFLDENELQEYDKADLILHIAGDAYGEVYSILGVVSHSFIILLGKLLDKPVIIFAQSLGPFITTKFLARCVLNKVDLITVREKISKNYLQIIGVYKPPIYLTADLSFLIKPVTEGRAREILSEEGIDVSDKPLISISISQLAAGHYKRGYDKFIELIGRIVDYVASELNATVILLPHVIGPCDKKDDRIIAKQIYSLAKWKGKIKAILNELSPEEIRGILRYCDLFIGTRMHANIAAISMCVPTIALAYSHKTYGIMEMLGQEEWVCDIRTLNYETLILKVNKMLRRRKDIITGLRSKVRVAQELALLNAKLVKNC